MKTEELHPDFRPGNDPNFPKLPDGSRDLLHGHSHVTTWKSVEKLVDTGKTRSIGVANYSIPFLEELLSSDIKIVPAVNQIENHPYLPQQETLDYAKSKGIHITAYSPLGSTGSPLAQLPQVQKIADKHKVEAGTVLISWAGKSTPDPHLYRNQTDVS
jgi:glycerol 2-dehydrogenase (NADP+)